MSVLTLTLVDTTDPAQRAAYLHTANQVWPEFAMSDEVLAHELAHMGDGRRCYLITSGDGQLTFGAASIERMRWFPADVPPEAYLMLDTTVVDAEPCVGLIRELSQVARELGSDELRILTWQRDETLNETLAALSGWNIVERPIDVGLNVAKASNWQRETPDGMTITTLAERPDLLHSMYNVLVETLVDIPGDEIARAPEFDTWVIQERSAPGVLDEASFLAIASGAAADGGDLVVGSADLDFWILDDPKTVWHGYTCVLRAWRGRGIASALKAATIGYALDQSISELRTENEERNVAMRAINASFGYEPLPGRLLWRGPVLAPLK